MDGRDTRLIPGTKREGRAKERKAHADSLKGKDGKPARKKRSTRDRKLKGGGERQESERKRDMGLGGIKPHENKALLNGV